MFFAFAMQVDVDVDRFGAWFVDTKSVVTKRVRRFYPFRRKKTK